MSDELLRTPLFDVHTHFGGRMVDFFGWSLPLSFAGIKLEHEHTRNACSLFDVSHMGRLIVTGADAEAFLNRLCTRNLTDAEVGRSYYSHMCKEDGGILDDLIVSRFEDRWGVVCNGANRTKIVDWLEKHKGGFDVCVDDRTMSTAMIAIQGPKTMEQAQAIVGFDPAEIRRYRFMVKAYLGSRIEIYRSGYTGEDGLEVIASANVTKMLIPFLLGTPESPHKIIRSAGLGARDTLRIEASMPLYGHELSEEVDPLTAGQGWCVDLSKDFIGVDAMRRRQEGDLSRRLVGLELSGRRIARQGQAVLAEGRQIGEITSGTLSPTLGKSIAMAFVSSEHAEKGTSVEVDLGRSREAANVVAMPFYKRSKS